MQKIKTILIFQKIGDTKKSKFLCYNMIPDEYYTFCHFFMKSVNNKLLYMTIPIDSPCIIHESITFNLHNRVLVPISVPLN